MWRCSCNSFPSPVHGPHWELSVDPVQYDQPSALNFSELVPHLLTLFSLFSAMLASLLFRQHSRHISAPELLNLLLSLDCSSCQYAYGLLLYSFQIFSLNTTFSWVSVWISPPVPCLPTIFLTIHFVLPADLFYIFPTYYLYSLCPSTRM